MNSARNKKIFELIFVPAFSFLPSSILSILLFIKGTEHVNYSNISASISFFLFYECLALSLIHYVLYKRNETFKDLGLTFSSRQFFEGIILGIIAFVVVYIVQLTLIKILPPSKIHILHSKNTDFIPKEFSLLFYVFVLVNAFTEEIIVRAFIIRETISIFNNKTLAVLLSVLFQVSYHLYQGLIPAIMVGIIFLIFSLYYIRKGQITPIILGHLIVDVIAILQRQH